MSAYIVKTPIKTLDPDSKEFSTLAVGAKIELDDAAAQELLAIAAIDGPLEVVEAPAKKK